MLPAGVNARTPIRAANGEDLAEIRRLLERHGLPTADLGTSRPWFAVAREGPELLAAGGLEVHGTTGLLRSIVVGESRRGTGLGRAVVERVESEARRRGLTELVLLTETARDFFARLGYADIARADAPESVRETAEFKALCPQSARCMLKRLDR
jgi:N-acetylglutamate synthase-like GNAT family acetyltransferase